MSDEQEQGASLRDRATLASPRAGSRLGHSEGIPSADVEHYAFDNGWTMRREEAHPYRWRLFDTAGRLMDRDQYRNDIIERHRLVVAFHRDPFAQAMSAGTAETRSCSGLQPASAVGSADAPVTPGGQHE